MKGIRHKELKERDACKEFLPLKCFDVQGVGGEAPYKASVLE